MKDILVIDIGGSHVKFAALLHGTPREFDRQYPTVSLRQGDPVERLAKLIVEVCEAAEIRPDAVVSTVPAFIDPDLDYVHSAGNIPELNGRHLATELGDRLRLPVFLERDSILLLRGEWAAGAGKDADQLLGIFFGTGVGGAFLQDGRPFRGNGFAMEIGSMPFKGLGRTLEGLRPDCLETYVSGRVLEDIAHRHGVPIKQVFAMAASNEGLKEDVDEFVRDMAMAVSTAIALLSPNATVVGGGLCGMPGFPRERLLRLIGEIAPVSETGRGLDLRWAELGWKAAAFGAALRAEEGDPRVVREQNPLQVRASA